MAILKLNNNSLTSVTELPSGVGSDPNTKVSLARLGLRVFANQNLATSNTQNLSYDVFQDSTGIQNLTNAVRNTSEFISSVATISSDSSVDIDSTSEFNTYFTHNDTAWVNYNSNPGVNNRTFAKTTNYPTSSVTGGGHTLDNFFSASQIWNGTSILANNWVIGFDFGANRTISPTSINFTHRVGYGNLQNPGGIKVWGSNDLSTITDFGSGVYHQSNPYSNAGNNSISTSDFFRYVGFSYQFTSAGTNYPQVNDGEIVGTLRTLSFPVNATGSFEGVDVTAPSSVSKMGAVITYEETGTNVLNTDIVMKLSADSGSNFTTATLEALPDFASGVKCAKISDTSVTPGTACTYQINFANQSDGVKEAKITGVALTF